jgi:hypothetical protein
MKGFASRSRASYRQNWWELGFHMLGDCRECVGLGVGLVLVIRFQCFRNLVVVLDRLAKILTLRYSSTLNPAATLMLMWRVIRVRWASSCVTLSNGVTMMSSILLSDVQSMVAYFRATCSRIVLIVIILKPFGGGAIDVAKVVPKLRIMAAFNCFLALCQVSCRSLAYLLIAMVGPVMPATIGLCVGSVGLAAIVVVAGVLAVAIDVVLFAGYAIHSASVMTMVRRPVGSINVAAPAATSSMLSFQVKKLISGS